MYTLNWFVNTVPEFLVYKAAKLHAEVLKVVQMMIESNRTWADVYYPKETLQYEGDKIWSILSFSRQRKFGYLLWSNED